MRPPVHIVMVSGGKDSAACYLLALERRGDLCRTNAPPDGRRYKALGNSKAVPVIRRILGRLRAVDQEQQEGRT